MGEAAGRPKLAVADAIDPDLGLPLHRFRNSWRDLRGDGRRVGDLGARQSRWNVLPTLRRR
jgi:hypothetical protein